MFINEAALTLAILTGAFRVGEIVYGEIKTKTMRSEGGKEFASWQRWPIFAVYALWLIALPIFTLKNTPVNFIWLTLYIGMQSLRWWAIVHLGKYWTTRIIIVPGSKPVAGGPYRFIAHPIYIALFGEVIALSMTFGQWPLAAFFGGLTALWIFVRVREENAALAQLR
ncbi:MAG: isoprenylcysteine carboxylmethyltransferase family protein [Alphaproteobacteria bacterium]|nr:isoprenylcysteine carboxylmethyltransferase family protein [Alphaproteobacteria bacterium]